MASSSSSSSESSSSSLFLPPDQTRLVTIAAHVDHGKTTLADNLIEHNGIISERLAGTLRYLDSDPEEQRRGITMRSSAIGLSHQYTAPPGGSSSSGPRLIHLVDSPGHTDFSWEVSSALTACDACLLVVDAVEGMGPRTHQVFREALLHQLVPVLVLNKVDRLCTDLCLTPTEAYLRLRALLESVNAAASAMVVTSAQQREAEQQQAHDDDSEPSVAAESQSAKTKKEQQTQQQEEELWTFHPAKNNVVFCSALFGWGFTATSLARSLFRQQLVPLKPLQLRPYLFGDYKLRGDKVLKWRQQEDATVQPIFAHYGLQPLWDIYQGVAAAAQAVGQGSSLFADHRGATTASITTSSPKGKIKADTPGMDTVQAALQVGPALSSSSAGGNAKTVSGGLSWNENVQTILTRTGATTEEAVLRALLRRFRPLAPTLLDVVCEACPSPRASSQSLRSQCLALSAPPSALTDPAFAKVQAAVHNCDTRSDAPTVAHVCKFFSSNRAHLRDPTTDPNTEVENHSSKRNVLLGLTRVLSGALQSDVEYYALGPKYTPSAAETTAAPPPPPKKAIKLYLLMGSSFVRVPRVPAGHLCAVLGLEEVQLKQVTLCDRVQGAMPLSTQQHRRIRPLVKVNIEAERAEDGPLLDQGLLQLSLADAAVEVTATARGERLLACLGELHLEQSLLDLKHVYCRRSPQQHRDNEDDEEDVIGLRTSDPIVDFGETTDWFPQEVTNDFGAFWDQSVVVTPQKNNNGKLPVPRQATIPPYNEEEGLAGARFGRARSVVSGRSAALSLRVVPLVESVHQSLRQQQLQDDSSRDELVKLGKALGLVKDGDENAQAILDTLIDCMCSLSETNGTAMMESPKLKNGQAVVGVKSDIGEVYMPPAATDEVKTSPSGDDKEDDEDAEGDKTKIASGKDKYDALRSSIRSVADERNGNDRGDLDQAALAFWKKMKGSAIAGFQMAVRSGPICEEPVRNILVVLEGFEIAMTPNASTEEQQQASAEYQPAKPVSSGMIVSALRSGIRCALLTRPARLMEGYLRLTLNSSLAGLGSLYQVLGKRRGKIEDDSMVDGTDLLAITALIPQAEAFGLAPELFAKTSGQVTAPEMIFSHWQRWDDVDPFWIPTTEEEREDYGELQVAGDSSTGMDNTALRYIRQVRERKGLRIDSSRTVVAAEKQRTLKR